VGENLCQCIALIYCCLSVVGCFVSNLHKQMHGNIISLHPSNALFDFIISSETFISTMSNVSFYSCFGLFLYLYESASRLPPSVERFV
jgi:hypothetical protein